MIESIIFNRFKEEFNGGLIFGLIGGLIFGLIGGLNFGLIFGLNWGLIFGLIFGWIFGLIRGLIFGLNWGLIYLINFLTFLGLASLISHYPQGIPIWIMIFCGLILAEIIFLIESSFQKKSKKVSFWKIALKKLESLWDVLFIFGMLNLGRLALGKLRLIGWNVFSKWAGDIGLGLFVLVIIVLILYIWIKLNSLAYKK